ncbi:MAG: hypothetical protein JSS49_23090 [Planctomycetes bacterium]|nr:hypothetical protein [Planctomycetota bacterium]
MRDVVVEKASPFAFLIIVMWYIDGPRTLVSGILHDVFLNFSVSFGLMSDFFG